MKPRICKPVANVYDRPDFRGLLHADFQDTISSAYPNRKFDSTGKMKSNLAANTAGVSTRSTDFYGK